MQTMLNKIRQYGRKLPRKGMKVSVPQASSKVRCFFCTTALRLKDLVVLHCLLQPSVGHIRIWIPTLTASSAEL